MGDACGILYPLVRNYDLYIGEKSLIFDGDFKVIHGDLPSGKLTKSELENHIFQMGNQLFL